MSHWQGGPIGSAGEMADGIETVGSSGHGAADVFVSYSRTDRARVAAIVDVIEKAGFTVWWDALLEGGAVYSKVTEAALEGAKAVVVAWSSNSISSHWVHDEATRGRDRGRLVPVAIDPVQPPLGFRQFQVLDFNGWSGGRDAPVAQALVRAIATLAHGADFAPARQAPQTPVVGSAWRGVLGRRRLLLGAGVLGAGAIGVGLWRKISLDPKAAPNSVAVLPFDNMSGDPAQDYFADGLSAEVRAALARNKLLRVVAQASSDIFKENAPAATAIARRLQVAFLLDGAVRKSGARVRVSAELIDGVSGFSRWAETFDRSVDDVLTVQADIASAVASALARTVVSGDAVAERSASGGTSDSIAYDAYLRARALYNLAKDEATDREALALFERAIAADPGFAAAHAGRARALTVIANQYGDPTTNKAVYREAALAARRATALAPDFADGFSTLGFVLFQGLLDAQSAREPFARSAALGQGDASVVGRYALFCAAIGQEDGALANMARAQELDPLNPLVHRAAGVVFYALRRFEAVEAPIARALALNPGLSDAHAIRADAFFQRGEFERAAADYAREPHGLVRLPGKAILAHRRGDARGAETAMQALIQEHGDAGLYQQAQVRAQWGEGDMAMRLLQRAYDLSDSGLVYARNDPFLDPLRTRAAFSDLLKRLGFA